MLQQHHDQNIELNHTIILDQLMNYMALICVRFLVWLILFLLCERFSVLQELRPPYYSVAVVILLQVLCC